MRKQIRQYYTTGMFMGIQVHLTGCFWTKKQLCQILDCTPYHVNNYVSIVEPNNETLVKNALSVYAYFDGGEMAVAFPNLRNEIMTYKKMKDIISEHRKTFKTHQDTNKYYKHFS